MAMEYHKDIVDILDEIKRELLLILKTNNYLRSIDKRLGNPNNTYNIINIATMKVFNCEMSKNYSVIDYYREQSKYWWLRILLSLDFFRLKVMSAFGYKASPEELQNFDLDYNE